MTFNIFWLSIGAGTDAFRHLNDFPNSILGLKSVIYILMERRRIRVKPYQEDSPSDCLCEKAREGIRVRLGYDRSSPGSSCFLFCAGVPDLSSGAHGDWEAVRSGLQYAGKQAAKEAYVAPLLQPSSLEADVVEVSGRTGWSVVL